MKRKIGWTFIGLAGFVLQSCQTYYHANQEFNQTFQKGDFAKCEEYLEKHKPRKRAKDKFLYQTNLGMVRFIQNKTEPSNEAFEKAFLMAEDFEKNPGEYAASLLTNPNRVTYTGERFERLMVSYFKTLNQLKGNNQESALIETRRLIRRLNILQDEGKKDKYNSDGFFLWMIGCFFEGAGEVNNAYIYYRKAHQSYQSDFGNLTQLAEPQQLKTDLIRAAYMSGFETEAQTFEAKFNMRNKKEIAGNGTALLLWHKGLGPVKSENRVTLNFVKGAGGQMTFTNEELGFSVPFFLPPNQSASSFSDLKFITMALPKYEERNTYWTGMKVKADNQLFSFQPATDLGKVAKADLKDRMGKELIRAVSRLAVKQAFQYAATKGTEAAVESGKGDKKRKQQDAELAGSLVNLALTIANASTEVADTRNWQTLPSSIEVLRISLPAGKQTLSIEGNSKDGKPFTQNIELDIKAGQTVFHTVHTF